MQWKGEVTSLGKGRKVQECEETEVGVRKKRRKRKEIYLPRTLTI